MICNYNFIRIGICDLFTVMINMNVPYLHVLQRKRRSVERKMRKGKGGKGGKGKGKGGGGGGGSSDVVEIGKILNDVCEDVDDIDEDVSFIYCEN